MNNDDVYIKTEKFYKSIDEVKGAINDIGQSLGDKIDKNKEHFDSAILKIHIDYTDRLARLEEKEQQSAKEKGKEWQTRILYGLCAAMATFILNHILTK